MECVYRGASQESAGLALLTSITKLKSCIFTLPAPPPVFENWGVCVSPLRPRQHIYLALVSRGLRFTLNAINF